MNDSVVIGVVGTAKNTGKTTTLSHLIDRAHQSGMKTAVTGIGYDGEEIDNITMLPKPRLYLHTGTILTTSEVCLRRSSIEYRLIRRTGISTALGELLIVEVTQSGLIVVAGPNKVATLRTVLEHIKELKREIVFVDGSINRMMPMSMVDRLIFATGAARNAGIASLTGEMKAIEFLFRPDVIAGHFDEKKVSIIRDNEKPVRLSVRSVIDEDDVDLIRSQLAAGNNKITIPGVVSKGALQHILNKRLTDERGIQFVFSSPINLLLSESPVAMAAVVESFLNEGLTISYFRKPDLIGVTVNPFYPLYEQDRFSAAYIDKNNLMDEMQSNLSIPVFNVMDDIGDDLFKLCIH